MIRKLRRERGASAVLVAVMLVPLIGAGAIAVDVGALVSERTELQNGVDGAALALAAACAKNEATCASGATATAQSYVVGNTTLPYDPVANAPSLNTAGNVVTVTAGADVDHYLARVFAGAGAETVHASGSAEWGTPVAGSTLPLAIGACEFEEFPPIDPNATPTKILVEYNTEARRGCDPTFSPGGFGWLDAVDCLADIDLTAGSVWHKADRGNNLSKSGCDVGSGDPDTDLALRLGSTVLIPIYDSFKKVNGTCSEANNASGGKICFHIEQFAAFVLTGFKLSGPNTYTDPTAPRCNGSCRGLQGYFVKYVSVDEAFELGDGDGEGLSVVRMIITPEELAGLLD
ncbi:pilus assembly protein TadG-related protein [Agromyces sp. NPDC058136]|uniref:pilus assembly protein TadG-related protein n=1 Tax=Agromyces sp. NPDC058136 TaxID=3346354 RepID=UPI0036DC219A